MDSVVPASPVPGFQALRVLDQDGTAVVYLVVDPQHRRAVLTVGHRMLADPHQQAEFLGWAARLAGVAASHPHLAEVAGHGLTADGRPYLVVRAGAQTLADRLRAGGALPAGETQRIGVALAGALAALHAAGLVHGVVRPATVLLDDSAGPVLAGFDSAAPHLGAPFAPSAFTPPEQLTVGSPLTPAADVYDLAATLYTAAGGRVPWASDDGSGVDDPALRALPAAEVPGVSEGFTAVLRAGLSVDMAQRPTAAALAAGLGAVAAAAAVPGMGSPMIGRALPVTAALLTGAGARPVIDALASLGGSGAATAAAHAGVGAAAAGYQTAAAAAPISGAVSSVSAGAYGMGTGGTGAFGTAAGGAPGGATATGIGVAKVAVIAVLAAVVGAGAVIGYNVLRSDPPPQRAAAADGSTTPSREPSSAPPTSASPSPTGPDSSVRGAARTLEEYLHAMGNGDAAGVCKIAAYEYMREYGGSYASNATRCRNEFGMIYGGIMSEADKAALRTARVDPTKVRPVGSNRAVVPRSAVTLSHSSKFLEDGWPVTMQWNGTHWYPTEK